jgi:glycosyltransferase involved in cell wall biosynthesis
MGIKISAIVCSHNRFDYLIKAVNSLKSQILPNQYFEIIVVDNASTDNTRNIQRECSFNNFKYIYEPVIGLSQSRNVGWRNASGEYIAYIDDDAIASPDWLEKIVRVFEMIKPNPGCVCGKVKPIWEAERPDWLSDELLGQLSVVNWSDGSIFLDTKQWFAGTNMAFPRKLLEEVGGFKTYLGRKGDKLLSMEENLLRIQLEAKGYKCFYSPDIIINHAVTPDRLSKKWFINRAYWNGASSAIIDIHNLRMPIFKRYFKGIYAFLKIMFSFRDLSNCFVSASSQKSIKAKCSIYARLGYITALLGFINED